MKASYWDHLTQSLGDSVQTEYKDKPYTMMFEQITPSDNDGPRSRWKYFEHYVRTLAPWKGDRMQMWIQDLGWTTPILAELNHPLALSDAYLYDFGPGDNPTKGLSPFYTEKSDGDSGFVPDPENLDSLKAMSLRTMYPKVKADLSLINSIIELKDFKSLPRQIGRIRAIASNMKSLLAKGRFGGLTRYTLAQLADQAAESYLQWSFNLSPLIDDITAIYAVLSRVERRINDLVSQSGRIRTFHYKYVWNEYPLDPSEETVDDIYPSLMADRWFYQFSVNTNVGHYCYDSLHPLMKVTRVVNTYATEFHAQLQCTYLYSQYQREHARVLALLDGLGVNFDPSIVWNALPWTFVIDWLISVANYLSSYKVGWMEPTVNILQYSWSVRRRRKTHLRVQFRTRNGPDGVYPEWYTVRTPDVEEIAYKRSPGMPDRHSIELSGLSLKELSLAAALIKVRSRKRYKRG